MRRWRRGRAGVMLAVVGSTLGSTTTALADGRAPTPVDGVGDDLAAAVSPSDLYAYGAALAETGVLAFGGGDQSMRVRLRVGLRAPAWGDAANDSGYVLPVVLASAVWATGLVTADHGWLGAGSAAVQALAFTAAATAVLKWSTGRPFPLNGGDPNAPDVLEHPEYARQFHPFNFRGDWAWPSGHTATITSVVAALAAFDPDSIVIPLVGYTLSAAIGVGMVVGDHHWTSDVIAGALLGHAVGSSVGSAFRARAGGTDRPDAASVCILPLGPNVAGAAIAGTW